MAAHLNSKGLTLFGSHTTAYKVSIEREKFKAIQVTDLSKLTAQKVFEKLTDFLEQKPIWLTKDKITRKWFGIRSRPVGEPSPIQKNLEEGLILCTGFYKNGFLLAPTCSNWVSSELKKYFL